MGQIATLDNLPGGFEPDRVDYNLADGVFSDARNVRFNDGDAEKCKGTAAAFGSLSASAIWALNVNDNTNSFWIYGSESILFGYDGSTHTQVSTLSYACPTDLGYTGGGFHGYAILNDSVNKPQSWSPGLGNKVIDLANWPASTTCKVIRPFGDFLVALGITASSVYNARQLRWSDAAPTGALPGSWDYTDPTNQSGIAELGQTQDFLIDCLPLRDTNVIYKQYNTWLMQYVGGLDVFQFRQLFSQSGMLAENCAIAFDGGHLVLTDSDVIIHDGTAQQSICDKKWRKWLFNTIDTTNYKRSFVVDNPRQKETWICIPQTGDSFPTLAMVFSRSSRKVHVRELGAAMSCAGLGFVGGSVATFDAAAGAFDDALGVYDASTYSPFTQQLVFFDGANKAAYTAESGEDFNGTQMTCYLERSNMGLTRDVGSIKRIGAVYPKVVGNAGDLFYITVGVRDTIDGAITWTDPFEYTMGTDYMIPDVHTSGRYISLRFSYTGTSTFRLAGFDVEFDPDGER
jgi:hypothetical protein